MEEELEDRDKVCDKILIDKQEDNIVPKLESEPSISNEIESDMDQETTTRPSRDRRS